MTDQRIDGVLHGSLPFVRFGSGPPLVVLSGLTATHANPTGWTSQFALRPFRGLAEFFSVYLVNRRPNLGPDTTMADLAEMTGAALETAFDEPVPLMGVSTGGSIALQTTIDHPALVGRLVISAAACRLSEDGRGLQRELMLLIAANRPRGAGHVLGRMVAARPGPGRLLGGVLWASNAVMNPQDPSDVLVTLLAEDQFDVCPRLREIRVPTLVVGGEHDRLYGRELFAQTAKAVPRGRVFIVPGGGHGSPLNSPEAREHILDFFLEEELDHLPRHEFA